MELQKLKGRISGVTLVYDGASSGYSNSGMGTSKAGLAWPKNHTLGLGFSNNELMAFALVLK